MVEIETVSIVFTGLSISLAAFYYIRTLQNAQRTQQQQLETRQAQLFMQIYSGFYNKETMISIGKFLRQDKYVKLDFLKYDESQEDLYASFYSVANYLEGVGVLVKRRLIDPTLVDDLMSGAIMRMWDMHGPNIVELRERYNYPQLYEYIEYLYNEIKPFVDKQYRDYEHTEPP